MKLISDLSEYLNTPTSTLIVNMISAPSAYKTFTIPKRSGGVRTIAQPTPFVKKVQRGLLHILLSKFETSESTMAYTRGKSIATNARAHTGNDFILKMDIENFFPSIKPSDLLKYLDSKDLSLDNFERRLLTNYLFIKQKSGAELSIGAPSSPMISNILMYTIDLEIEDVCKKESVTYTRYADDLTFSCNDYKQLEALSEIIKQIIEAQESPSLTINNKKTKIVSKRRSQRVTGVILTQEGGISIGRTKRKKIRAMLHLYKNNKLNKNHIPYLHGIVSHLRNIEPVHFASLENKYGDEFFKGLAQQSYSISKKLVQERIKAEKDSEKSQRG